MARRVGLLAALLVLVLGMPAEAAAAQVVSSVRGAGRVVALTFDDGWDAGACARVTDTLRARHAVGTFFINGIHLRKDPPRWRRILDGMPVGNHTRSHPNLVRLSDEQVRRQIRSNERIHANILGRPMHKLLRPPYGSYDDHVRRIAGGLGYRHLILWNMDARDWMPGATVSGVVARATGGGPGSIVLMHCGPGVTPRALPAIIRSYRERGFRLVGLDELLGLRD